MECYLVKVGIEFQLNSKFLAHLWALPTIQYHDINTELHCGTLPTGKFCSNFRLQTSNPAAAKKCIKKKKRKRIAIKKKVNHNNYYH